MVQAIAASDELVSYRATFSRPIFYADSIIHIYGKCQVYCNVALRNVMDQVKKDNNNTEIQKIKYPHAYGFVLISFLLAWLYVYFIITVSISWHYWVLTVGLPHTFANSKDAFNT